MRGSTQALSLGNGKLKKSGWLDLACPCRDERLDLRREGPGINRFRDEVRAAESQGHALGAGTVFGGKGDDGDSSESWINAQLVDDKTGRVLGNILTPIPVKLDGT